MSTFKKTLLEFFNSSIQNDKKEYGYILESGQLHPKIVKKMIDFDHTIIVCLGLGDLSIDDIITLCLEHDKKEDWTYGLSKDYLKEHAKDWYNANKVLKEECPKYGIPYFDTSKNRIEILNTIMNHILKKVKNS